MLKDHTLTEAVRRIVYCGFCPMLGVLVSRNTVLNDEVRVTSALLAAILLSERPS